DGEYQIGSWDGTDHKTIYKIPTEDQGQWVHLAGVYDGTNWILYRNGSQVSITSDTKGAVSVNNNWAIGSRGTTGSESERFFAGQIDEVRIWNVARSQTDIQSNKDKTLNGNETNLVAYYQANEGTGTTLTNKVNSLSNGQLQNGVSWQGSQGSLIVSVDASDVSRISVATTKAKITGETVIVELLPDVNTTNPTYTLGGEDVNLNGKLDLSEDTNLNGKLDSGEDKNNNGKLDLSEDKNTNSKLDPDGNTSKATLSIQDDDVPGIRIVEVGNHTVVRERETATYEISLLSEPTNEVKITLTPGAEIEFINPINPTNVQVDKDVYKFNTTGISNLNVELKSLVFTDQGDTVAFEIKLPQKPTKDQIVELYDANDTTKDLANTKQVTFTAQKWDGIQQANIDGNWQEFQQVVISNLNKGANGNYAIKAVIKDRGATSGTEINIPITHTIEKVTKQTTTLTINPTDWYKLQTVTIQGSNDDVSEPGIYHADSIKYAVTSDDKTYKGLFVPDQTIHVVDRIIDSKGTADALGEGLKSLQDSMDDLSLPLIGSLDGVAPDPIGDFSQDLVNAISSTEDLTASKLKEIIENVLSKTFGKNAFTVKTEVTSNEISVLLDISKNYELFKIPLSTDLGIPALGVGLTTEGDLQANFNYNFSLGFGLHDDFGFYIDTDKTSFKTDVTVDLDQFEGQGSLGFLKLDFADDDENPTKLAVSFEASLNDLDNSQGVQFFDVNGNGQLDSSEPFTNINEKGIVESELKPASGNKIDKNENGVYDEKSFIQGEGIYRKTKDNKYYFDVNRNGTLDTGELFTIDDKQFGKPFKLVKKIVAKKSEYYYDDNGNGIADSGEKTKVDKKLDKNNNLILDGDQNIQGEGKFVQGTGIAFLDANSNGKLDANSNGKLDATEKYLNYKTASVESSSVPGGVSTSTNTQTKPTPNPFKEYTIPYKATANLLSNDENQTVLDFDNSSNKFDPNKFTFVITHGFESTVIGENPQFRELGSSIYNYFNSLGQSVNVILWDWSEEASGPLNYQTNANKVDEIGDELATFLQAASINPTKTQLIGHSLGAHVMGNAGERYKTLTGNSINSIVGLDPAGPLFESDFNPATLSNDSSNTLDEIINRLDPTDATRVVALHTSNTLGFDGNLGALDLFINWSDLTQPGASFITSNHSYATQLYTQLTKLASFSQAAGNSQENNTTFVGNTLDINDIYNIALKGADYVTTKSYGDLTKETVDQQGKKISYYDFDNDNKYSPNNDKLSTDTQVVKFLDDGSRLTLTELANFKDDPELKFSDLFNYKFAGEANLGLKAETSINNDTNFPSVGVDLAVNLPLFNYGNQDESGSNGLSVNFNNITVDLGGFISDVVKPVIDTADKIITPIKPIIQVLNADTKIFGYIGLESTFDTDGKPGVSILEIAKTLNKPKSNEETKEQKAQREKIDKAIKFADIVTKISEIVDLLNNSSTGDAIAIDFGSYSLDDFKAASKDEADAAASVKPGSTAGSSQNSAKTTSKLKTDTESQANKSSKDSLISKLKSLEGLSFPILTSPTTAISLLLGESGVDLITYDIPDFAFDFNIQQTFPIFSPISGILEPTFRTPNCHRSKKPLK
ncbi:hypothetical protein PN450_09035, partial [Dolichospermum lemmermannii CS-548]|uniref:LamG-like jellyroll fold domain-containing protein n=1 Tax=Dolichospermum lemmermannii TaxID=54295 RepID=UPI00232BDD5A